MDIRLSWMDSGALEYSVPTPFAFEMVRVDASRRATSSAETTAFSLADAFFVGAMGFGLVFALVAISKCLEEFKDKQRLARRHASSINHVIVQLPHAQQTDTKYKNSKHVRPPLALQVSSHQSSPTAHRA